MEKKEILDQSGITFKGLLVVFKRIWYWLFLLVVLCCTGFTLMDAYTHKSVKYTYTASARLILEDVSSSNLEDAYSRIRSYLYDSILRDDVNSKYIETNSAGSGTGKSYNYVDDKYYDAGLVNVWSGSVSMYNGGTDIFFIYFSSSTSSPNETTPKRVMITLQQICYSLQNRLGYSFSGQSNTATSDLEGNIEITSEIYNENKPQINVNSYTTYSNPKAPVIGVVIGLILSCAIVLLVYKLDDTIKSKDELESLTGVMFITYIEDIEETKGGSK